VRDHVARQHRIERRQAVDAQRVRHAIRGRRGEAEDRAEVVVVVKLDGDVDDRLTRLRGNSVCAVC
jgi:hypothetical protein